MSKSSQEVQDTRTNSQNSDPLSSKQPQNNETKNDTQHNQPADDLSFLSSLKMSDLIDTNTETNQVVAKSDDKLNAMFEQKKREKKELEELQYRLMQQTMSLNLKVNADGSKKAVASATDAKPEISTDELLYKKLEKKWGLNRIEQPSEEDQMFMDSLLDKSDESGVGLSSRQSKSGVPNSINPDSTQRFLSENPQLHNQKRKNISEYQARYSHEIDAIMQGSHLDLKQEQEAPKIMRYMNEFREFKPQINIGERWGTILQESTVSRLQYEQQIAKGGNLISYMARTGKLGIDLYFIVFGLSAAFILPYAFYLHQKQKINYVQKVKNINPQTVPDFYYSEYDLDEISVQKSFYNQFTDEIVEEKNKKLKMHKEIHSLTNMLFSNK